MLGHDHTIKPFAGEFWLVLHLGLVRHSSCCQVVSAQVLSNNGLFNFVGEASFGQNVPRQALLGFPRGRSEILGVAKVRVT